MVDLNELAEKCDKYSRMREKNGAFGDNDDVLKHCAGEVVEAVHAWEELFRCKISVEMPMSEKEKALVDYADELMDAMYCLLVACKREGINVELALLNCIDKNRKRAEGKGDKK